MVPNFKIGEKGLDFNIMLPRLATFSFSFFLFYVLLYYSKHLLKYFGLKEKLSNELPTEKFFG